MTAQKYTSSNERGPTPRWMKFLVPVLGAYALVGGTVSLLGWVLDNRRLTDWDDTGVSIQPNAAVAVILTGIAILLLTAGYRRVAFIPAAVVTLIGGSSLIQLMFDIDLGINTLLMFGREWGRGGVVRPGQMGPPGSVSWLLLGICIALISISRLSGERRRSAAAYVAIATTAISALSLMGYLYGATPLYMIPHLTVIAWQTATFVCAASVALILNLNDVGIGRLLGEQSSAGLMARRVIPAIIIIPVLLGFLRLSGERAGYYDLAFGSAARTLIEIALMLLLLVLTAQAVRRQTRIAEEREASLRNLADAMPQVVWIAGADGRVHYYNDRASNFGGIQPDSANTFDWQPGLHKDDLQATLASWHDAVTLNQRYEHEHRILMADGTYRWHLSRAVPVSDGNGSQKWYGTATDIHDLKGAEERIRESEQRFSRFMHHLPGLAWIKDRMGRYVYVNEAAEKAFGKPAAELIGRTDKELFPPGTAEFFESNDREALKSDTGVQVVEALRNEKGELRESLVSKFPIPVADENGPFVGGMAVDITEQRRARLNEEFLFRIAEMIRTGRDADRLMAEIAVELGKHLGVHRCYFGEIDLEQGWTRIKHDYYRDGASISGTYPVSEFSLKTFDDLRVGQTVQNRDSQHDPRTAERFEEIYLPSKMISYINVPLLREGTWKAYLFCSHEKVHDWTAAEISLVETVAERTWAAVERARAEDALRESEERYRLAQQAGNVGIWDWDIINGRTYWSEQMWTLYGEPPQQIDPDIGFWNSHLHPDDRKRALDVFEHTLSSDAEHHNDVYRIVRSDNSVRWIESIATVERDAEGRPVRMYGVNLDITELQVAHDELEVRVVERTQELAKTNTMLLQQMEERAFIEEQRIQLLKRLFTVQEDERGRIARDIHDHLGQRLTALRLKIASVRALCEGQELLVQRVTRLQEISELLDKEVSFLAWELRPEILDKTDFVHALEQYVMEWSRHSDVFSEFSVIGLKEIALSKDIQNNLYRITQEALNNAAKYARASRINVLLEERGKSLILIIEDDGVGFDTVAPQKTGVNRGFGLVGMRERASLIGGTLEIESTPGEGTTVFVKIPLGDNKGEDGQEA